MGLLPLAPQASASASSATSALAGSGESGVVCIPACFPNWAPVRSEKQCTALPIRIVPQDKHNRFQSRVLTRPIDVLLDLLVSLRCVNRFNLAE